MMRWGGSEPVLSRHRLPPAYRWGLMLGWLGTPGLMLVTLLARHGLPNGLEPRALIPLLLMTIPAFYIWREGIDVLPGGLRVWQFWPRHLPDTQLESWTFDDRPNRRVLTVWDSSDRKLLEFRAGHLTNLPALLAALKTRARWRE